MKEIAVTRVLRMDQEEAWGWLTDPAKTALHFGRWVPGTAQGELQITMAHEEGQPTVAGKVLEKHKPDRLVLSTGEGEMTWVLTLTLQPVSAGTAVTLRQEVAEEHEGMIRAGWEFYADCLVAAVENKPAPKFEDYLPVA